MNRRILITIFLVIQFLVISYLLPAEELRYSENISPDLSRSAEISMVTVYPGNEIYSLFGHSSFRVFDPERGIDWMFNYGTFDFDDQLFLPKFVKGQLDYYISVDDFPRAFRFYTVYEKRKVVEQVLNLDYEEKKTVFAFLLKNSRSENRYYKYDFIHDNCSTRIADVLVKCFGEKIYFPAGKGNVSFRKMIASYLTSYPFLAAGIELVLGSPSDRIPVGVEKFFLPVPMIEGFDNAELNSNGSRKKLVSENNIIIWKNGSIQKAEDGEGPVYKEISNIINYPFYIFSVLFVLEALYIFLLFFKKDKMAVLGIISCYTEMLFIFVSGIIGILIFYLWFLSDHIVPNWNFHILWLSPVSILYLISLISGRLRKASVLIARILFISAVLFLPLMLTAFQSLSLTFLPLYFFTILIFFKRGLVREIVYSE